MKILVSWLRDFVDAPADVRELGDDLTAAGLAVDGVEMRGDDAVLDLDITTNRVDGMNVYGVAREVSVIYGVPLKPLPATFQEKGAPASEAWSVEVQAPDLCPRFCGRVLDIRIGPSPDWMRARLEASGVRPINNVVDLTNYVMIEMGQPSHAFDLAKIPGFVEGDPGRQDINPERPSRTRHIGIALSGLCAKATQGTGLCLPTAVLTEKGELEFEARLGSEASALGNLLGHFPRL